MSEPMTWQVIQAVRAMVAAITIANGFRTDLGAGAIFDDRGQLANHEADYVLITASDIDVDTAKVTRSSVPSTMQISIEYGVALEGQNASPELLAHRGRADLVGAILWDLRGLLLGLRSLTLGATSIGASAEGSGFVIAQVQARAALSEPKLPAN